MKKSKIWTALVLAVVLILGAALYLAARPEQAAPEIEADEYMEYENAVVEKILSDSTEVDPVSENHHRGI